LGYGISAGWSIIWVSSDGCHQSRGDVQPRLDDQKTTPQKNSMMKFKAPKNSGFPWFFFTEKMEWQKKNGVPEKNDIMIIMMFVAFCSSLEFPCFEVILRALVWQAILGSDLPDEALRLQGNSSTQKKSSLLGDSAGG